MTANKIIKIFIITFAVLALVILFLMIASYLSYAFNKQKNTNINISEQCKSQPEDQSITEQLELLRMSNPGSTDTELLMLKEETRNLPVKTYTDEELRAKFSD